VNVSVDGPRKQRLHWTSTHPSVQREYRDFVAKTIG
jgi:hypothetical protein